MIPNWFYSLSIPVTVLLCSVLFVGITLLAGVFVRPRLILLLKGQPDHNLSVGYFLGFFNLMNGLLLSLLAVATYQNHANVERIVVRESASLAALYRDVSSLPEPHRSDLQSMLRDYTKYIINEAWPMQQRGLVPEQGTALMDTFQKRLIDVSPANHVQEMLQAAGFRQFNEYTEWRRLRLYSVKSDMPSILWYAVGIGLLLHFAIFLFLNLRATTYLILGSLISFFTGTVICMILLLDHPFVGPFGVSAEPFQILYDGLMRLRSG